MTDTASTAPLQPGLQSLSKSFEPAALEAHWGPEWEKRGYGVAGYRGTQESKAGEPAFAIQLPPPNVTGTLHMGHAFNQTIMDSLTRYHRMRGYNTAWIPGTDHAGIATQIVVERQLQDQKISRHDLLQALVAYPQLRTLHRPANLEDLFLKLTGRQIREDA